MIRRLRVVIGGAVQGVGFRPFVHRLARALALHGWVENDSNGVVAELEGEAPSLETFLLRLEKERPPRAFIQSLEFSFLDPVGFTGFEIRESNPAGDPTTLMLPDIAVCDDCLREVFDPGDRRYRYPFTNCTNCGPRFSIIEALPYDRANTSMRAFEMCPDCTHEYRDPADRRFHAQPNACPACGPHLELWTGAGEPVARANDALVAAAEQVRAGRIVAVKGLGGFHFLADARSDDAVALLRQRKHREEKPFAVMYPTRDMVAAECAVSDLEGRLLSSPESPIVLLRRTQARVAEAVAPGNPYLGVMLPYTPLHHLLMAALGFPVVATSGNLSNEPICTDEREALDRLRNIADAFLVHNRPIVRHVDDSIVRVLLGREQVLRRARGYAPLPIRAATTLPGILAVGAHQKNAIALTVGRNIFVSQHIGDLENAESLAAFREVIDSFQRTYPTAPLHVAADLHPGYLSTRYAAESGHPMLSVQHHHAHVVACMAENDLHGPVLGVSWDGTGHGPDGTVWGGEFLLSGEASFRRVATLRRFRLPGAEQAVREPRRSALGLLYELLGDEAFGRLDLAPVRSFGTGERGVLKQLLANGFNSPWTSSAGRLFDAVAAIVGLRQLASFEGQAAMELEFALLDEPCDESYPFSFVVRSGDPEGLLTIDWAPIVLALVADVHQHVSRARMSHRFHNTLAEMIVATALRVGEGRVVLTGGCFQNRYLTERTVLGLTRAGFQPYWHQRVPPNDGGIALGQAVIAAAMLHEGAST